MFTFGCSYVNKCPLTRTEKKIAMAKTSTAKYMVFSYKCYYKILVHFKLFSVAYSFVNLFSTF